MAEENKREFESNLAGYVNERFDRWKTNRTQKQLKWERNLEAFLASFDNHWKLKNVRDWETPNFIRVTKQKVMAGFALVCDVMMQGGKIPYQYKYSPWADKQIDELPEEVADIERTQIKQAKSKADEQLQLTRSERAFVKNILSGALYGETVAKFHVKTLRRKRRKPMAVDGIGDLSMVRRDRLTFETVTVEKTSPAWGYISVWDFFYDEEGGIYDGRGCIHRRLVNNAFLRKRMRKKDSGFIAPALKKVIEDSSKDSYDFSCDTASLAPSLRSIVNRENNHEYKEYWGRVPRKYVEDFEAELKSKSDNVPDMIDLSGVEEDGDEVECCVHVVDNEVVFFARTNPEDRPFEHTYWEDPLDELSGTGIADNCEDMQGAINEFFNDLKKNKKLAGSVKGIIKRRMIDGDVKEADFENPGKMLEAAEDCQDARQAYQQIITQDVGSAIQPLLTLLFDILDEDSMIARIMQGGEPAGDVTAKQIMEQTEKGGKYIATVVQNYDERLIEPMMNRFFDFNMSDPENRQGRGDFVAEALGFTSFMDRQVRIKALTNIFAMVVQTEALQQKYDIASIFEEIVKGLDANAEQFERSEEEIAKLQEPSPLVQLEIQGKQAEVERVQAAAAKEKSAEALNYAKIQQMDDDGKIRRAQAVNEIMEKKRGELANAG